MQLFVRCLGGRTLSLQLPADSCVASLRREVEVRRLFFPTRVHSGAHALLRA
jgi:hypothetical protein